MSKPTSAPHGTTTCYRNAGCRCDQCREAKRRANADWKRRNPNWHSDYYRANVDERRSKSLEWTRRNPHLDKLRAERKRAIRQGADIRSVSVGDWLRLCARHDNRCAYCHQSGSLTQDHIIPIVRGGRHAIGNLLPACGPCNSSKGSKLLIEWRSLRLAA